MKKNLLVIIASVFLLSYCSSNENENIDESSILKGTWNLVAQTLNSTITISDGTETEVINVSSVAKDFDFRITFSENPNTMSSQGSFKTVTTTSMTGQPDRIEESISTSSEGVLEGTWTLSANTLIINPNNDEMELISGEVTIVNDNTIMFSANLNVTQNEGDFSITNRGEFKFTITK